LSDVKRIVKIINTGSSVVVPTTAMLTNSLYDVTNRYTFDNGQRDNYYDHASITLRPGAVKPVGNLLVLVDYYKHTGGDGYFSKMSYVDNSSSPEDYREIPNYTSKHGASYRLRDCIDFRPARLNAQTQFTFRYSNPSSTRLGVLQPADLSIFLCDYSFYLGRRDKLVLTKDKALQIMEGSPSINPLAPNEPDGALVLVNLIHQPYTGYIPTEIATGLSDLSLEISTHRRYRMSDIGALDTRINRIEYYTALNLLEQNTNSLQISDAFGLNRFKNGIMVDDFSGFGTSDAGVKDFSASINRRTKRMTAKQTVKNFPLKNLAMVYNMGNPNAATLSSLNYSITSDGYTNYFTLPFTSTNIIAQRLASRVVNLNPFAVTTAKGTVELSPNVDTWVDTSYSPSLLITDPNLHVYQSSDTVNTLQVGDWQTVSGTTVQTTTQSAWQTINAQWNSVGLLNTQQQTTTQTYNTTLNQQQTNVLGQYSNIGNTYALNNGYITDISIMPWIRSQALVVKATGMLYNTTMHAFFDTVDVDNYTYKANVIELTDVAGAFIEGQVVGYYSAGNFVPTGLIVGIYDYPNSANIRLYVIADGNTTTYNNGVSLQNAFFNATGTYQSTTGQGIVTSTAHNGNTVKAVANSTQITLSPLASATNGHYVGQTIYISGGTGAGQSAVISSYNGTSKVIQFAPAMSCAVNDAYSIGPLVTNEEGSFYGLFNLPENKFHTGTREFHMDNRINNNVGSITTTADGTFYAQGLQANKQNIDFGASPAGAKNTFIQTLKQDVYLTRSTSTTATNSFYSQLVPPPPPPVPRPVDNGGFSDPVAQTFLVDATNYPNGIFLSSARVFFASKPATDSSPVKFSIVGTLNGYPNGNTLDNSIVTLPANQIKVSSSPQYLDSSSYTEFKFKSPVYIKPNTFYAFILKSDSNEYTVWTAANGDNALPSSVKNLASDPYPSSITKISKAPYVGGLFLSQNSVTWDADQNQAMMFTLERCKFDTTQTPSVRMVLPKKMPQRTLIAEQIDYYKNANTTVDITGTGISNEDMLVGAFNVTTTDFVPSSTDISYTYDATLQNGTNTFEENINPGKYGTTMFDHIYLNDNKGERVLRANSETSFSLYASLYSVDDAVSPVLSDAGTTLFAIQYDINNCPLSNSLISIISGGTGYNANTTSVTISSPTGKDSEQAYASPVFTGNVVTGITITTPGAGYIQTPTITIVDANTTPGTGATAIVAGETSTQGGPAATKYITKKVVLEAGFDSGDLSVYLGAYRPVGTDISVYYKALSRNDTQSFDDGYWQLMTKTNTCDTLYSLTRDDTHEYTFAPGTAGRDQGFVSYLSNNGQTYYTFSQFALKIVLTTTDNTVIPHLSDMRCIALPSNTNTTI
jgi:hypothetical protein